jgi:hypothetical protein
LRALEVSSVLLMANPAKDRATGVDRTDRL